MSEYVAVGDMVEGKKCSISARRYEFKRGGLHKDPITNENMVIYELDRNSGVEVRESLILTQEEQDIRNAMNVHGQVGDKIQGDAIRLYVDTRKNSLKFMTEGGHTGRHGANVAYSTIRTIGKIKTPFKMYDKHNEYLKDVQIMLIEDCKICK